MSDLLNVCRLCMKTFSSPGLMKNIFSSEANTIETIRIVTQIEIVRGDGLPPNACRLCLFKLNNAKNFIQSCVECNEKLKSECMLGAAVLTASNGTSSASLVSTPEGDFAGRLKTEPLEFLIENASTISAQEPDLQNVNPLALVETDEEVYLKYEVFDETDAADICGPPLDNENNGSERDVKSGLPVVTSAHDSILGAAGNVVNEGGGSTSWEGANEISSIELSIENLDVQIKRENIAACRENDDELHLSAAADEYHVADLQSINSKPLATTQGTNITGCGDIPEPILPLSMVISASCQEASCYPERTSTPTPSHKSNKQTAKDDDHETNSIDSLIESPNRVLQDQPSSARRKSAKKRLLLSLSQKRKPGKQCPDCFRIFPSLFLLRQHTCDLTENCKSFDCSRMFECKCCSAGFSSRTSLEIHIKQHTRNRICIEESGLLAQTSDYEVNSSDSERSIFELNTSASADNIPDLSSDSEGSNMNAYLDSEDRISIINSDSDSCKTNRINSETDVSGSNSDSEGTDTDASVESEGSGLIPNSGSESDCPNTSTELDDSYTKPGNIFSEPDVKKADRTFVSVNSSPVTCSQNSECKKNKENEYQVCLAPTPADNAPENKHTYEDDQPLGSNTSPCLRPENPTSGSGSSESDSSNCSSNSSTKRLHLPHSDGSNSPSGRYIRREDADDKQKRKRSCVDQDDEDLPPRKLRRHIGSKPGIQEKCKGEMPCVQPGGSGGVPRSVSPVVNRTRSRTLLKNISDISCSVEPQSSLGTGNSCVKNSIFKKKQKGDNENKKLNEASDDSESENDIEEPESEKSGLRDAEKLKQCNNLILEGAAIGKTEKQKTNNKEVTANVVMESTRKSGEMAKARGTKENDRSINTSSCPTLSSIGQLQNLRKDKKNVLAGAPALSYQCWECSGKFESGEELITHFCRHLRDLLLEHSC